jgi:thioesterase III
VLISLRAEKSLNFPIFNYPVKILEHHLDAYGHVNNVAYIAFFEQARWDMVTMQGCGLDFVRSSSIGPVVLEIDCKFRRELRLRQDVVIQSQLRKWRGKVGQMSQIILDNENIVYCEALITFGLFDLTLRKLVIPNDRWRSALSLSVNRKRT